MADSIYEVLIKFGLDDAAAKKAVSTIKQVEAASESNSKKTDNATKSQASGLDLIANKLKGQVAAYLSIGAAVGFISMAVNQYIQQAGTSESTSRKWLETTQQISFATTDIGRIVADKVLPAYQDLAKFITGTVVPGIQEAVNAADLLIKGPGIIHEAIDKHRSDVATNPDMNYQEYLKEYRRTKQFSNLLEKPLTEEQWKSGRGGMGVAGAGGANMAGGGVGPGNVPVAEKQFNTIEELYKFLQFKRAQQEAQKSFDNQMFRMDRDFKRSELYATEDFQRSQRRGLRDHQMQLNYAESEFYRQRAIAQRDFNISLSRSEYDYQLSRKRAEEDHNFSLKQIMLSGDALQYYYSQRQFNIDKQRAEEDYQRQRQRSQEDFGRQQNDSLIQFNISRAFQKRQWEISRADQLEDFKIQRKRSRELLEIQRSDMIYAFEEQNRLRRQAMRDQFMMAQSQERQLANLKAQFTQSEIASFNIMAQQGRDFLYDTGRWLSQLRAAVYGQGSSPSGGGSGNTARQRASGGYVDAGMWQLHDEEFVLSKETTQAAEKLAKSNRLTQESIINAMNSGLVYNDNREFSRGLTPDEKAVLRQETMQWVMEAYNK